MAIREAAPPAAELAGRDGPGRVCRVEPLGTIEDDPNVTDKRFPGNPTRSYRTTEPLRVLREITGRKRPPPEMIQHLRECPAPEPPWCEPAGAGTAVAWVGVPSGLRGPAGDLLEMGVSSFSGDGGMKSHA
jgi:hypothetical protein